MAHYAKVTNGVVTQLIEAEKSVIDSGALGPATDWIQSTDGTDKPLRINFAGMGSLYDKTAKAFYLPRPFESWTLNKTTWRWEPPTPEPTDIGDGSAENPWKNYIWDEALKAWKDNPIEQIKGAKYL